MRPASGRNADSAIAGSRAYHVTANVTNIYITIGICNRNAMEHIIRCCNGAGDGYIGNGIPLYRTGHNGETISHLQPDTFKIVSQGR